MFSKLERVAGRDILQRPISLSVWNGGWAG